MFKKNSLRFQIFLSMTLLVLVSFAILALVMVSQYKKQALEYHDEVSIRGQVGFRLDSLACCRRVEGQVVLIASSLDFS